MRKNGKGQRNLALHAIHSWCQAQAMRRIIAPLLALPMRSSYNFSRKEGISIGRCCPVAGRHRTSHAKSDIKPKDYGPGLALQVCATGAAWQSAGTARRTSQAIQAGQHKHAMCHGENNYFFNDLAYSSSSESAAEVRASSFDVSAAKSERRRNSFSPTTRPRAKTFLSLANFLSTKNSKLKP